MRGITRAFRGRLAKMERVCHVGEFDHMSMDELQDYCDREVMHCLLSTGLDADAFLRFIQTDDNHPNNVSIVSSFQQHVSDMRQRGMGI
jgi:hypothetical protein